jgi:hypothetical protein
LAILLSFSAFTSAGSSCPDGTEAACLEPTDIVCAGTMKCVDQSATCLQDFPCKLDEGFLCAAEHDAALEECRKNVAQFDSLAKENVDLRQERLDRKNCVLNSATLADAHKCVR